MGSVESMGSHCSLSLNWRLFTPLLPVPDHAVISEEILLIYHLPLEFHEVPISHCYQILNTQATHLQY